MASFAAIHARLSSVFVSAAAPAGAGACFSMFKRGGFLRPPLNSAYSIVQENLYFSSTFSLIFPDFTLLFGVSGDGSAFCVLPGTVLCVFLPGSAALPVSVCSVLFFGFCDTVYKSSLRYTVEVRRWILYNTSYILCEY